MRHVSGARSFGLGWAAVVVASVVLACGSNAAPTTTYPPTSASPVAGVTAAVTQTRAQVANALGDQKLVLRDVETPYRPAEAPLLASAPRAVFQVILQQSPDKGFIVIYEFRDVAVAAQAAAEQAQYLATGPGRVQWPLGTHHVIRGVGTTVIVYDWLPGAVVDPAAPGIESALETVGEPFVVPG